MVVKIEKKNKVQSLDKVVRLQIVSFAILNDIHLNKSSLDVAVHIGINGYSKDTLQQIVDMGCYKDVQCVRNCRRFLVKANILVETEKRKFCLNPEIGVVNDNVLFILKVFYGNQD